MSSRIPELRNRWLELENQQAHTSAEMRALLAEIEEEERRRVAEAERFEVESFTEKQVAKMLGVSAATMERDRKRLKLPHLRIGVQVRYLRSHLKQICSITERNPVDAEEKQAGWRKQRRA